MWPDQRSLSIGRIGARCQAASSSARRRSSASSRSWPSAKMSAVTSSGSPTTRLTGYRPPSSSGAIRSITMARRLPTTSAPGSGIAAGRACATAATARRTLSFVVVMAGLTLPHRCRNRRLPSKSATMPPMPRLRRWVALGVALGLMTACDVPAASSPTAPPSSVPAPSASANLAPTPTDAPTATAVPIAADPPPLALEQVADGLVSPISIAGAPGGWLLVNEQAGRVVAIHPQTGERATVVELNDRVTAGGERGLLGLALHPAWPEEARAFVHYSDRAGDTVLSELSGTQDGDGPPVLDPASERVLLALDQPYPNHNGGQIAFGPDGYLWVGLGDGGSAGDPLGNGQDPSALLGSILRLDVSTAGAYAIPPDNPFADDGGAPEVYLWGLRNPWRFSFDPQTGALWIGDVGQDAYEEVDRLDPVADAGANLGWNLMEGAHCFADAGCSAEGLVLPLAEYGRDQGYSVTGGHVYRGTGIAALAGWYVFADYGSGLVFGIPSDAAAPGDGRALAPRVLLETGAFISSFGVDGDGELYIVDHRGGVLSRIVAGGG
jgi:glucose/arabinose dehydrogenase